MTKIRKIYTWTAQPAERSLTVADLRAGKGTRKFTQITANTEEEAHAAGAAGIDMMICNAANVAAARKGNSHLFLTAALGLPDYPTSDDILRGAFGALAAGADAVMTARSMRIVEMLAHEDIPVMGHLGLVPRKSTWVGGLRAVGKTGTEAAELFAKFKSLENAGAFAVEAEVIPGRVMGEISRRCGLITVSLGSGKEADVMYLFMEDVCGDSEKSPRHGRAFGDLLSLRKKINEERIKAVTAFRESAMKGDFPTAAETVDIDEAEVEFFLREIGRGNKA